MLGFIKENKAYNREFYLSEHCFYRGYFYLSRKE